MSGRHVVCSANGRTALLLMNLMLMRDGYPPIVVRPEDRPDYIDSLEAAQSGDAGAYEVFMHERLEAVLDHYISFLAPGSDPEKSLTGRQAPEPTIETAKLCFDRLAKPTAGVPGGASRASERQRPLIATPADRLIIDPVSPGP